MTDQAPHSPTNDADHLVVTDALRVPLSEFEFTFVRSSGPGGQNVNKRSTKAQLRWPVDESTALPEPVKRRFMDRNTNRITGDGDFLITSQRYRDQGRNSADCLDKLRAMLQEAASPPKRRKKSRPPRAVKERRLRSKRRRSERKQNRKPPRLDD